MKVMPIDRFIEDLQKKFTVKFEYQKHSEKRVYIRINRENLKEVARIIFKNFGAKFAIATGVDIREGFEVLYHFTFDKDGFICTIRTLAPRDDPKLVSIIPGALWIEREIYDILGVRFTDHPNLKRLVKAEFIDETDFPFRKDFNIDQFKKKHKLTPESDDPNKITTPRD
jgi:NADH:ubiquinone oxidoreductase subunit C